MCSAQRPVPPLSAAVDNSRLTPWMLWVQMYMRIKALGLEPAKGSRGVDVCPENHLALQQEARQWPKKVHYTDCPGLGSVRSIMLCFLPGEIAKIFLRQSTFELNDKPELVQSCRLLATRLYRPAGEAGTLYLEFS